MVPHAPTRRTAALGWPFVSTVLSALLIAACVVAAGWSALLAARDRLVGNGLLVVLLVAELLIVAQLVVSLVSIASGDRPDSVPTFLAYAIAEPFVLPVGLFWSQAEKSRSSTLVLTLVCVAAPVMTGRMLQMWSSVHG
jgi:hypothetical protein